MKGIPSMNRLLQGEIKPRNDDEMPSAFTILMSPFYTPPFRRIIVGSAE